MDGVRYNISVRICLCVYQIGSIFTGNINVVGLIFAILVLAFIIYMLFKPYKESTTLTTKVKVGK